MIHRLVLAITLVLLGSAIASSQEHALAQSHHLNVLASNGRPSSPPLMPPNPRPVREEPSNNPQENPSVTEIASNPSLPEEASNPPQENTQFA
jgi:hypothetical protein